MMVVHTVFLFPYMGFSVIYSDGVTLGLVVLSIPLYGIVHTQLRLNGMDKASFLFPYMGLVEVEDIEKPSLKILLSIPLYGITQ